MCVLCVLRGPLPRGRMVPSFGRNDGEEAQQRLRVKEPEAREVAPRDKLAGRRRQAEEDDAKHPRRLLSRQVSRKTGNVSRDNRGKGAAEDFLREWRDEEVRKDEELSGTVSCETPVYRYVLDYIDLKESTGNILASTADGYRWYAKHLLGTELGKTPWGRSPRGMSRSSSATWYRTAAAATPSRTPTCCSRPHSSGRAGWATSRRTPSTSSTLPRGPRSR